MGLFFYNIFLWLFRLGTFLSSPFNAKAKLWTSGRRNIFAALENTIKPGKPVIWIHCASLGEFEQGRPLIEKIKNSYSGYRVLLTFFSPSGYEVRKGYEGADWVFYLPMDGPRNAKRFLEIVKPSLVIFVKYEFWYYYLKKIKYRNIPLVLVSALFRKDMSFFKWYGAIQRKILSRFDHLFVQDEASKQLIDGIGLSHICSVSGDTRFDRVIEIAEQVRSFPLIESFTRAGQTIIAGSTWPEDEEVLEKAFRLSQVSSLKLIIAPHEISEKHISDLRQLFPGAVLYSELASVGSAHSNILIIDNIGMLAHLYKYGTFAYIGGGLRKSGIHNVLEAAVYDKIVLFGPYYGKYSEAVGLVQAGGGLPFNDEKKDGRMLAELIRALLGDNQEFEFRSRAAGEFVRSRRGATGRIMNFFQEKRLLTN